MHVTNLRSRNRTESSLSGLEVRIPGFTAMTWVQTLIRELRSYKLCGKERKKERREREKERSRERERERERERRQRGKERN